MQERNLKFLGYTVTLLEVPDEIALVFNISGCPHKCAGCHSEYLWEYEGEDLFESMIPIIAEYKNQISCVCFMGGDQNMSELKSLLVIVKELGYKTCVYSGADDFNIFSDCLEYLDWLKIGGYKQNIKTKSPSYYGIQLATKNQILYKKGIDY